MQTAISRLKLYGVGRFVKYAIYEKLYLELWMQKIRNSYSQAGEDVIIDRLLGNKKTGFYIDVGAYDPTRFNNTKRFYKKGWTGVNIEPNIVYFKKLEQQRKRDINLNLGVFNKVTKLNFYKFFPDTLSTFSRRRAKKYRTKGFKFIGKAKVRTVKLSDVLRKYAKGRKVDFLSVDTEGLELAVLKSNGWGESSPKVICIESSKHKPSAKKVEKFLLKEGYRKYWSGHVNDIYTLTRNQEQNP